VDLTHEVPPQDVRAGAWILHTSWRHLPAGAICLAVVDPGVGTARRAIACAAGDRLFVGPDNGLFGYILADSPATAAVALDDVRYQLPSPSATFHGRDIFAPAAAHLAVGVPLASLGGALNPTSLVPLALPRPERVPGGLRGHIVHEDHFGNLITTFGPDIAPDLLRRPRLRLHVGGMEVTATAATFGAGPAHEPFAFLDSSGHLAVAIRDGSAAARLGVGVGAWVLAFDTDVTDVDPT
jgi:hypothetical protein